MAVDQVKRKLVAMLVGGLVPALAVKATKTHAEDRKGTPHRGPRSLLARADEVIE